MQQTPVAASGPVPRQWSLDAYVIGACWSRDGRAAAFALGDGSVHLFAGAASAGPERRHVPLCSGQVLAIQPDSLADAFFCSTDDGVLCSVSCGGTVQPLLNRAGAWIDALATHPLGGRAAAVGNSVHLLRPDGTTLVLGPHGSTVAGVGFNSDGTRVAAAHYEGCTLWSPGVLPAAKRSYSFPGSHLLVSFSPDDRYVATTTQEKEVHVWRVADASDLRMSGYYAKVRSLAWTADARWLLTSGADTAIAWGFDGSGPEGKPPRMLGPDTESHVSCVACHPKLPLVAIGYADGAIALARVGKPARELPVREPRASPVTALAFAPDGQRLAAGTQDGLALLYAFDYGSKPSA